MKARTDLTAEYLRSMLDYYPETQIFRWKVRCGNERGIRYFNWRYAGKIAGHKQISGYTKIWIDGASYAAHRLAFLYVTGKWPAADLDHIDRDKKNDAFDNLREATRSQNVRNSSIRNNNTSGAKGITWHKRQQQWVARIYIDGGRRLYLGSFTNKDDAIAAYKAASLKYHQEFSIFDGHSSSSNLDIPIRNIQNKNLYRNSSSGFRGVSWSRGHGKWQAYIRMNGKTIYLGYFSNKEDAIVAYHAASLKYR